MLLADLIAEPSHANWNRWLVVAAFLAHFGTRLAIYNRVNALGWRRRTIKRIVKATFLETWVTAIMIAWWWRDPLTEVFTGSASWERFPTGLRVYAVACLTIGSILGGLWLVWRPIFRVQHAKTTRHIRCIQRGSHSARTLARTTKCLASTKIPFNQILDLAIEQVELTIPSLPSPLDGYRIAHLTDIHLTGHIQPGYVADVVEHAMAFAPEMIALTGDLVDVPECIDWLPDLFSRATAEDGCHFILGNHDTRIADPDEIRRTMKTAGWNDVGGRCQAQSCRDVSTLLIGNEWPWFNRPGDDELERKKASDNPFQICLSHSPDQFDWARRHDVDLMLCGHTHGGQGRLPLAGPILSPSWHGSRWASGDFYRAPTTMHVSRGLGGVHLLRINCRPELSLITLRRG